MQELVEQEEGSEGKEDEEEGEGSGEKQDVATCPEVTTISEPEPETAPQPVTTSTALHEQHVPRIAQYFLMQPVSSSGLQCPPIIPLGVLEPIALSPRLCYTPQEEGCVPKIIQHLQSWNNLSAEQTRSHPTAPPSAPVYTTDRTILPQ
ncbi:hypothetical protein ACHAP5_010476 [Fusarium lateritium]